MRSLVLIVFSTLLLLAPGFAEDSCCTPAAGKSLEGRIQPAGPSIYMEGSHELVDSKGELLARLSGMQSKLDLGKFENEWVKVSGEWRPTVEAGGQILEVSDIEKAESTPSKTP